MKVIEDHLLQVALHLLHLAQNHRTLAGDLSLTQLGVLDDVGQDLDGFGHILGQTLGVEDGLLPGSVGVQVGAQVLNLQLQIRLRALGGTLKSGRNAYYTHLKHQASEPTLKAMCSRKWATPLFFSFSERDPASIHSPTVAVEAPESSLATRRPLSSLVTWVAGMFSRVFCRVAADLYRCKFGKIGKTIAQS